MTRPAAIDLRNGSKADIGHSSLAAHSRSNLDHIEVGRPLLLQAGERSVAHRPIEVRLALFERCRSLSRGHLLLAKLGIVQRLGVHASELLDSAVHENRPIRGRADVRQQCDVEAAHCVSARCR